MLENFIYAKKKSLFEEALNNGEVLDEAIVFIEDTKEIWNHGTYFDGNAINLKTINGESILGEGDLITDIVVNSVEELNLLDVPIGTKARIFNEIPETVYEGLNLERTLSGTETNPLPPDFYENTYKYTFDIEVDTNVSFPYDENVEHIRVALPTQSPIYVYIDQNITSISSIDIQRGNVDMLYRPVGSNSSWENITYLSSFSFEEFRNMSEEQINALYAISSAFNGSITIPAYVTVDDFVKTSEGWVSQLNNTINYVLPHIPTHTSHLINNSNFVSSNDLTGYATETYVNEAVSSKQGIIDDLDTIRSGAALGATAVQPEAISDMETKTNAAATYQVKGDYITTTDAHNYTDTAIANLVDSAPDTLNTLNELATAITEHQDVTDALNAAIGNKLDKTEAAATYQPIGDYAKTSDIPTKVSELENDVPYVVDDVMPENGVYIVDLVGNLHTTDSWTGGSDATGVVVITDQVSIIVAPDEWYTNGGNSDGAWNGNTKSAWGGNGTTVTGIKITESSSDAITDFAGSANTDAIISQLKGTTDNYSSYYKGAPAAEYCRAYSKGYKGVGQWYLPSAGEINVIAQNRAAVEEALNKISGELLGTDNSHMSWTSTQYSSNNVWYYYWDEVNLFFSNKNQCRGVRPICAFTIQSVKERVKELESSKQDTLISGTNIKNVYTSNGDVSILGSGDLYLASVSPNTSKVIATGICHDNDVVEISIRGLEFIPEFEDPENYRWSIHKNGDGTKFLSDDGTYKTIDTSGGSSSGGSYAEVSHGTSDTTFTLTPNTFHVWDEVVSLDLSFGEETSGVANEFLFQFTSGATATTLTLPSDIKWANDSAPTIAENMIYQISVLKGLASVLEFSNAAPSAFPLTIAGNATTEEGKLAYQELERLGESGTLAEGLLYISFGGTSIPVTTFGYDSSRSAYHIVQGFSNWFLNSDGYCFNVFID